MGLQFLSLILILGTKFMLLVTYAQATFPPGKSTWHLFTMRLHALQSWPGCFGEEKNRVFVVIQTIDYLLY
jgi:hypothetical protein